MLVLEIAVGVFVGWLAIRIFTWWNQNTMSRMSKADRAFWGKIRERSERSRGIRP